eukprot:7446870-Pyramimonas_sp.AAC.1
METPNPAQAVRLDMDLVTRAVMQVWISREGWKNREIKQREAMKQQVLTDNITKLLGLASLDATHNAAFDHVRTAGGNTGRYWPCTRGRICFKKGAAAEIKW